MNMRCMMGFICGTGRIAGIKKGRIMRPLIVLRLSHCQKGKVMIMTVINSVNALYASDSISLISSRPIIATQ
jgi:hypothetical protein